LALALFFSLFVTAKISQENIGKENYSIKTYVIIYQSSFPLNVLLVNFLNTAWDISIFLHTFSIISYWPLLSGDLQQECWLLCRENVVFLPPPVMKFFILIKRSWNRMGKTGANETEYNPSFPHLFPLFNSLNL
jgi:hypothetical protein